MAGSSAASSSMISNKNDLQPRTKPSGWSKLFRSWRQMLLLELLSILEPRNPTHID